MIDDEKPAEDWAEFRAMMNEQLADSGLRHYDRDGNRIGPGDAMFFGADPDYCRVALSHVTDGPREALEVSTVWLGTDLRPAWLVEGEAMPPIIFETMTFNKAGAIVDELCQRYSTHDEARAGHARIVERAAAGLASPIVWHVHPDP